MTRKGGDVAITTSSRQRPPFQGLVLYPSPGGYHGDEVLRDGGNIYPHLNTSQELPEGRPSLGGSIGPL